MTGASVTDRFGHDVPATITLEDPDTGEPVDLPLFRECCDKQEPVVEETPHGPMDRCDNCGSYI